MAYKVRKTVVLGDSFIEHRYNRFPETYEGKWKKVGVFVHSNPSAMELTCQWCRQDWRARLNTWPISGKLFSYRVVGVTEPGDFWEWEMGRCGNGNACWGRKERIWDVRRERNSQRFRFAHHTLTNNVERNIDQMYATFERSTGKDTLVYTSITRKWDQCKDFWPDCLPEVTKPKRHIHISMASKECVPEDYEQQPKNEWPEFYQTAKYLNPNRIQMRYFDEQPGEAADRFNSEPVSLSALERYLPEIARTRIEMYPGGSGLKVSQYKKIQQWQVEGARVETDWLPQEWRESYGGYIPDKQHGWAGPVVSYWARLDASYRYFS